MSERKAINKYYPPDYDPSKEPKKKKNLNPNINRIRLMVPFSMKCTLCNEYIAAHRKFNARKEVTDQKYMGVKIIKFHIKCPRCNSQLVFRTDPKLSGFEPVSGVVRNYVSSKTKGVQPEETEDQMLERLERQEKENQEFQLQREKRKANPFWQALPQSNTTLEGFEERLLEQQKEQQMHDHLTFLQAKAATLQNSGGAEAAILRAQEKIVSEQALLDGFFPSKRPKTTTTPDSPKAVPPTVLGKIQINPQSLKRLSATRAKNRTENENINPPSLHTVPVPVASPKLPQDSLCPTRGDIAQNAYACNKLKEETREIEPPLNLPTSMASKTSLDQNTPSGSSMFSEQKKPILLADSLAGYSSSEDD